MRDDDLAARIEDDYKTAGVSEERLAMLDYAVKLTVAPGDVTQQDVENLSHSGFTDIDILHVAEVVGYYAYANRIADGLGVPLEEWIPEE